MVFRGRRYFLCLFEASLLLIFYSDVLNVQGGVGSVNSDAANMSRKESSVVSSSSIEAKSSNEPYFESRSEHRATQKVSVVSGKTAFLSCIVKNLGKSKSVTWIRHRDVHILTVGKYTYTTDQRFKAFYDLKNDEWVLVIRYVQQRDAGIYECQIPSQIPKSYPVHLSIVVPDVHISGSPDIHVNQGSLLNLTCTISFSSEPLAYVFWYKGDKVVPYDSSHNRIRIATETNPIMKTTYSNLIIDNAGPGDSGRYTCEPSIDNAASVNVHVIKSEFWDALHEFEDVTGLSSSFSSTDTSSVRLFWMFAYFIVILILSLKS